MRWQEHMEPRAGKTSITPESINPCSTLPTPRESKSRDRCRWTDWVHSLMPFHSLREPLPVCLHASMCTSLWQIKWDRCPPGTSGPQIWRRAIMPSGRLQRTAHSQKEGAERGQAWEEGLVIPATNQDPFPKYPQAQTLPSSTPELYLLSCHPLRDKTA